MQKGETIVLTEADQKRIWRENEEKERVRKLTTILENVNGSFEDLAQIFVDTAKGFDTLTYIIIDDFGHIVGSEKDGGEFIVKRTKHHKGNAPK